MPDEPTGREGGSAVIDTSVPHSARRYDYWLGGKDNFPADRASGDAIAAAFPTIRTAVQENRGFLRRAVDTLAREYQLAQFLDIGTGLPTSPNVHEVAQAGIPEARVVYVDNDPIVLAHARAMLTSSRPGELAYIDADLREPEAILANPALHATLDLTRPVGLLLVSVLHFVHDDEEAVGVVQRLMAALPTGSFLAITQGTWDFMPEGLREQAMAANDRSAVPIEGRDEQRFGRFFSGLELLPPGIVPVPQWRSELPERKRASAVDVSMYAAVGRKP